MRQIISLSGPNVSETSLSAVLYLTVDTAEGMVTRQVFESGSTAHANAGTGSSWRLSPWKGLLPSDVADHVSDAKIPDGCGVSRQDELQQCGWEPTRSGEDQDCTADSTAETATRRLEDCPFCAITPAIRELLKSAAHHL